MHRLMWIYLTVFFAAPAFAQTSDDNGIHVEQPKVYDDRALQQQLNALRTHLSQVNGLDQAGITARIGSVQGGSASTTQIGFQAGTVPTPSVATTTNLSSPSLQRQFGSTTNTAPPSDTSGGGTTYGASSQTTLTAPSATTQTATNSPSLTPSIPTLPGQASPALPSTYNTSSLDTLNEQLQLSYEIINLETLLGGSLTDEYSGHLAKHHSTIGFPISIETPPDLRSRNAAAEVEVSVMTHVNDQLQCKPKNADRKLEKDLRNVTKEIDPPAKQASNTPSTSEPPLPCGPSLMTILPREKTYNVAGIVNKSVGLGVGAVLGQIISVGGNFLWGKQTYYLVQEQDTVAIERASAWNKGCVQLHPLTFAWQFRPVLGEPAVHQGLRQTFAQLSIPPEEDSNKSADTSGRSASRNQMSRSDGTGGSQPTTDQSLFVHVRTHWKEFDRKTGAIARVFSDHDGCEDFTLQLSFDQLPIGVIHPIVYDDGTIETKIEGHFLPGTRVRLGADYVDESTPGFVNNGTSIEFAATALALALKDVYLVAPDGSTKPLVEQQSPPDKISDGSSGDLMHTSGNPNTLTKAVAIGLGPNSNGSSLLDNASKTTCGRDKISGSGCLDLKNNLIDSIQNPPLLNSIFASASSTSRTVGLSLEFSGPGAQSCNAYSVYDPDRGIYDGPAGVKVVGDGVVEISLKRVLCEPSLLRLPGGPYPLVAIVGGKLFGIGDNRFESVSANEITFRAPMKLLEGQTNVRLKRIFLGGSGYAAVYKLDLPKHVEVAGTNILSSSKTQMTYAITGGLLERAKLLFPSTGKFRAAPSGTLAILTISSKDDAKQVALGDRTNKNFAPILVTLPAADAKGDKSAGEKIALIKNDAVVGLTAALYAMAGQNLQLVKAIHYLDKPLPFSLMPGNNVIMVSLPTDITSSPGIKHLDVVAKDGSEQQYDVSIK